MLETIQEEDEEGISLAEVTLRPKRSRKRIKKKVIKQTATSRRRRLTRVKQRGTYKAFNVEPARKSDSDEAIERQSSTDSWIVQFYSKSPPATSNKGSPRAKDTPEDNHELSYVASDSECSSQDSRYDHSYAADVPETSAHGASFMENMLIESEIVETTYPETVNAKDLEEPEAESPSTEDIVKCLELLQGLLPDEWIVVADWKGFHFLQFSSSTIKTVQREIFLQYNGSVSVLVHCSPLPPDNEICSIHPETVLYKSEDYMKFCQKGLILCWQMTQFDACPGADFEEGKALWADISGSYVDLNPYLESSYSTSCRSNQCRRLITRRINSFRCSECSKVLKKLKEKLKSSMNENYSENTSNIYLSKEQTQAKLKDIQQKFRKATKRCDYLQSKIEKLEKLMEEEGVDVDEDVSQDFARILERANLSEMQQIFLQEQFKYAAASNPKAHRWHPALIRLAIKIKMASTTAYESLRDSGFVSLPHSRTLFDYTHCIQGQVGVNKDLLKMLAEEVAKQESPENQYHALIFDEMYVSQNLTYRKSDGALMGYAHLDQVDKEIKRFENFLEGKTEKQETPLAATILAFMVKGLTSNVKFVVASFPCKALNRNMIYARNWEVISQCEGAGVKILSVVSDGSPINRAFYKLHTPIHGTASGVVYDTLNIFAPDERPLFFIADVAHLLKTIRNGLYNSREGQGDQFRCLQINGQKLVWKVIVRLYYTFRGDTLRECFKLNSQNVFPNSYSTMKVKYAAQVLSQTVANALKKLNWPGTEELIKFLEMFNKFFDVLNGAHSSQHIRQLKPDLAPYDNPNDIRFQWLKKDFWEDYILNWKESNAKLGLSAKQLSKTLLSYQALEGMEISIWGFTGATQWLLTIGQAKFVMARAFSQDPLEQHYSLQRGNLGGSSNPNVAQFLQTQISTALQGKLKTRRRKANVEDDLTPSIVSDEPLPKLARKSRKSNV